MAQRLALIIGNSVYRDQKLSRLATPEVDVGDLADLLLDTEIGNFDDVKILANMSFTAVRSAISNFFSRKKRDDLLLLYFSGHGVLDDLGRLYLAVKDTNTKLLRDRAISANFISDEMNNSYSQRQVLILDCCHSGAFARGTKGQTGESVGTASAFEGTGYGRVILTASDATQYAWEGDQVIGTAENSLFTHFLVQGLKSGKADLNNDGKITVDEMFDFVYENVVTQTPKQTPGKWSYKERGEIIIALHQLEPVEADIAAPSIKTEKDLENEFERNLEKLYLRGLSAYHLEEWENAASNFKSILELRTSYRDTAAKLEEANRQLQYAELYQQAAVFQEKNDWQSALSVLEELYALKPDYKDISSRLEGLRTQKRVSDLYHEAQQLFSAGQWKAVLNIFTKIEAIQPDFPDNDNLKAAANQKVAEIERQELLIDLYQRSLQEMEASRWDEALRFLEEIHNIEPGYEETQRLREKVLANISEQAGDSIGEKIPRKKRKKPRDEQIGSPIVKEDRDPKEVKPIVSSKISASPWIKWLISFALLIPGTILFVFFQGWPLLGTLLSSFQSSSYNEFVGFENYLNLFSSTFLGSMFGNLGLLLIVRWLLVLMVWYLLHISWRRMHSVPKWVVLTAVAPLPFLFTLGNIISWIYGYVEIFGASSPHSIVLLIEGFNTFAVSAVVGLLVYSFVQRMHKPGSEQGIAVLKVMRNVMVLIASVSAIQTLYPGFYFPEFRLPINHSYNAQFLYFYPGQGSAISSLLTIALGFCTWLLWRTLKKGKIKLLLLAKSEQPKPEESKVSKLLISIGVLPVIIIFLPYFYLLLVSSLGQATLFPGGWQDWFSNNLLFPGLAIWIVQMPTAFMTGYVLALKTLPGRYTKRILIGLVLFSAILGTGVLSGKLIKIFSKFNLLGHTTSPSLPLFYSGFTVLYFYFCMRMITDEVDQLRGSGKSEWHIIRHTILPRAMPLTLLLGITSIYWASQNFYFPLLLGKNPDQWNIGRYFFQYSQYGIYNINSNLMLRLLPLAIPCAIAIVLLVRVLLQRFAIIVESVETT